MREKAERPSTWSNGDWGVLREEFGDQVALAFRDAATGYWRRYRPQLASEGAPLNKIPFSLVFGLAGLAMEARDVENWPVNLSEAEAEIAFRYALRELNGFPPWFKGLYSAFPDLVVRLTLTEVRWELAGGQGEVGRNYVLNDLSWSGQFLWPAVALGLRDIVAGSDPVSPDDLRAALAILQGSPLPDNDLAGLAAEKVRRNRWAPWFAVWMGVAPQKALPALEDHLTSIRVMEEASAFAMEFVTQLVGGRSSSASYTRDAFRTPGVLKPLYILMHRYIRWEEDINRSGGGVYTPGPRDQAQDARDQLSAMLQAVPGKEAFLALAEIAQVHPNPRSRAWFRHAAKSRAEADADGEAWSPAQVRDFDRELERTPRNHRELFDLAVARLEDLRADLEGGDSSVAPVLMRAEEETEVRNFVGGWCRDRARGRYALPQEEELADAKRPDLRFHGVGFDAPVPVELKLADKWSGPTLFERLENQLCGDYLRDARSSRGVFLLVHRGRKGAWDLPSGGRVVGLDALVQALRAHWLAISPRLPRIEDVQVTGIDLTKRAR